MKTFIRAALLKPGPLRLAWVFYYGKGPSPFVGPLYLRCTKREEMLNGIALCKSLQNNTLFWNYFRVFIKVIRIIFNIQRLHFIMERYPSPPKGTVIIKKKYFLSIYLCQPVCGGLMCAYATLCVVLCGCSCL